MWKGTASTRKNFYYRTKIGLICSVMSSARKYHFVIEIPVEVWIEFFLCRNKHAFIDEMVQIRGWVNRSVIISWLEKKNYLLQRICVNSFPSNVEQTLSCSLRMRVTECKNFDKIGSEWVFWAHHGKCFCLK